ncbi:SIMPL domain-containing protein [Rhodoferax saidenbachensis]|uniref:SIMPL domain-containing protein n=1 Tax=Rhodoferax saidenbachensis TaxID=1484693 RepID=A0A1P8K9S6_9BURK|nr:SIMPL domain-containing protein [Rhodoferax saidenbachensis]APW42732.1 SIMPL domain-containing protein [Rhodoferax saidenbachensis]
MKIAIKIVAACAFLVGASALFAQQVPVELRNVVQLSSSGTVEVQQDLLTLTLSSTRDGADPAVIQTQLKQALDAALVQAKPSVLAGAMDLRTGQFSLQPRYNRDGKITGWSGTTELVLEGRDFARIGAAAAKIQTLVIANASFGLSRELRAKVEAEAQQIAIDSFKAKGNDIARGFGFTGYSLREVSVNSNDQGFVPRPRMAAMEMKTMAADAAVPMEAGKSAVVVSVSGSVQLK